MARAGRKAKAAADPDKPKRPLSAYFFWLNENRANLKQRFPGLTVTQLGKKAGEAWRALTDKSKWERMAKEAQADYQQRLAAYKQGNAGADDTTGSTCEKKRKSKAPAGASKRRKAKAPAGASKKRKSKSPAGASKKRKSKSPAGASKKRKSKAPAGAKKRKSKAPAGASKKRKTKAPAGAKKRKAKPAASKRRKSKAAPAGAKKRKPKV